MPQWKDAGVFCKGEPYCKQMSEKISIKKCNQLHPEQWVKIYGLVFGCCEYINTCQIYQLETVIGNTSRHWFEDIVLQPVDEEEHPVAIAELIKK